MIFEEMEAKAKGARALTTCAYFSAYPRLKLHLNRRKGVEQVEEEFEGNTGIEGPRFKDETITSTCIRRKCST
jgi:hypothetical protein